MSKGISSLTGANSVVPGAALLFHLEKGTACHPAARARNEGITLDPSFHFASTLNSLVSASKLYLNPSTFLRLHGLHASPSCWHLFPEWLKPLTGTPAPIPAAAPVHSHTVSRVTEHMASGLRTFRWLSAAQGKKILLLLPSSGITSHTTFCVTHCALDTLTSFASSVLSYFPLRAFALATAFIWNVFTWRLTTKFLLQWRPDSQSLLSDPLEHFLPCKSSLNTDLFPYYLSSSSRT